MTTIRVTKIFSFETGHMLKDYDGPCRNVHGHSYKLYVTLSGTPLQSPSDPKSGMVIDFSELKKIVKSEIVSRFDHAVVVNSAEGEERIKTLNKIMGNVIAVDYQPTCENMVADFAARIKAALPEGPSLFSLKLYETATSYAEWYASDNN